VLVLAIKPGGSGGGGGDVSVHVSWVPLGQKVRGVTPSCGARWHKLSI
jgi:hypothetical protein